MKLLKSKFLCKRFPPLCQFNVNTSLALDYKIKAEEQKILRRLSRMIMIGWLRLLFTNPVTSARRQIQPQWQLYWWLRSLTTNCRTGTAAGRFPHLIHHIPCTLSGYLTSENLDSKRHCLDGLRHLFSGCFQIYEIWPKKQVPQSACLKYEEIWSYIIINFITFWL